jgi:glycogen phosphorylase
MSGFRNFGPAESGFEMKRHTSFSLLSEAAGRYLPEDADESTRAKLYELMSEYLGSDVQALQKSFVNHVEYTLACNRFKFGNEQAYRAAAFAVRDRLLESFNDTNQFFVEKDPKRAYYMSLEFLVGRLFQNSLVNLDLENNLRQALSELGFSLEDLIEQEKDAALGNGGLGRLAACFLDSMATLNLPIWGYGLRYSYGIFEQRIVDGRQYEIPDFWLSSYNPWEIVRPDVVYGVRLYGSVHQTPEGKYIWTGGEVVSAVAYDNLVPGYGTINCNNLRLWKAEPSKEFDFQAFNQGRYADAVLERQKAENLTSVLYPNDNTEEGKELRLKQQYLFVCATLQDILRRFKKKQDRQWSELPTKVAIQLNDTHPSLGIPEMMRLLVDIEGLEWFFAWSLVTQVFNYTNHTVLPEALEKWPADMIGRVLPRHLQIINRINQTFLDRVAAKWGWNSTAIPRMSIYEEGARKMIRMANLCVIGSNKVNGVAAIHTEIIKKDLFPDFHSWFCEEGKPTKFLNMTNGVTPRRWIYCANRPLSDLITSALGGDESWLSDLSKLRGLELHKDVPAFQAQWNKVKLDNKKRLAELVKKTCGITLDTESVFDMQIKRIHEYKRQLMFLFYIIHRYMTIKGMSDSQKKDVVKRTFLVAGKAAPGYFAAKSIIKLFNNVSKVVNDDPDVNKYMKVVFFPNYNVSSAQIIIPASDVNQQISLAGTEASGTSNMKFVMNGSLIVGTLDGANVEIVEECGENTVFVFGSLEHEVDGIREKARNGEYKIDPRLQRVFQTIRGGSFSRDEPAAHAEFTQFVDKITNFGNGMCGDHYLVCHDFPAYLNAQEKVDHTHKNKTLWTSLSIQAVAGSGKFSTDRTIAEYAADIWNVKPEPRTIANKSEVLARIDSPTTLSAEAKAQLKTPSVVQAAVAASKATKKK